MAKQKVGVRPDLPVNRSDEQNGARQKLTKLEKLARREQAQSIRVAAFGGQFGNSGGGSISNADSAFYSPQLSTDFLELPQSEREKRELFRFWYTCFVPGSPILMADGTTIPIEEIRVGDRLPNGLGSPTSVVECFKCDIDDNIVRAKVRGVQDPVEVTGNHPFYVFRASVIDCKYTDTIGTCKSVANSTCKLPNGMDFGKPEFVYAKDLCVGDYVVSPWTTDFVDSKLSRQEARLLGYYAAEGSLAYRKAGVIRGVEFSLNIDEADTIGQEISDLYQHAFGKHAHIYKDPDRNTSRVVCDGIAFARFCEKHAGRGSHEKHLSEELVKSNPELTLDFLGAYWNGDGCFTDNSYTADTMSGDLASQVHQMLRRVGIPAYHSQYDRPIRVVHAREYPAGTVHYVSFPGRFFDVFSKYANFVDGEYSATSTRAYVIKSEFGFLHRVESLEAVPYKGPVYNFEVLGEGDTKSYIAHGLATHNTHPIVGAAIDFHTDVPMSKIRLSLPKGKDLNRNKQILHFFEQMCKRVRLFQTLYDATHEYWLHGNVFVFCEDHDLSDEITEEMIADITEETVGEVDYAGRPRTRTERKKKLKPESERVKATREYVAKHYHGWERLQILPPEQVKLEVFQYTNRAKMELIPSEKDRIVVMKAQEQHDPESARIAEDIPEQIRENLLSGQPIPLNTSPYDDFLCSSFCYHLTHKKSSYDDRGISILERCLLPGTEVLARRLGVVEQVLVEDLDPNIHEVLGSSGAWRHFDHGSRPVTEQVCSVDIHKINNPIRLTKDHKLPVLRDGVLVELEASQMKPGDFVRVSQIPLHEVMKSVDLKDFVALLPAMSYTGRRSGTTSLMEMKVVDETAERIVVRYCKKETDSVNLGYYDKLQTLVDWISSQSGEIVVSGPELAQRFGFHSANVCDVRKELSELGLRSEVRRSGIRNLTVFFPPEAKDTEVDKPLDLVRSLSRHMPLDSTLGYVIGYFLGDGWIKRNATTADYGTFGICYSLKSSRSCASASHIKSIFDSLGIRWTEPNISGDQRQILTYHDVFTRWLASNFGHTKADKHFPEWIFQAPKDFLFGILRGLYDSDGAVTVKKTGVITAQFALSTKHLIDQIQLMMLSLGLPVSRHLHKSRDVSLPNGAVKLDCLPLHQLAVSDRESVKSIFDSGFMAKKVPIHDVQNAGWGTKHRFHDGYLFFRVRSVQLLPYDGPVYSLNVDQDHKFYGCSVLLNNCLRTLLFQDKLRQAQTSIASRAMTPKRVIWADKMSEPDVENLRDQIDQAIIDPDFSVITNFEIHWDEVGARDRLLDLSTEYEITNKLLFIGLRITESMLTGESTYSGERIHLDVMNTMYLLYRETLSQFVEEYLFAPVAEKKGFWEDDEYGNRVLLYPKLQFTRLALRDNTELQDFMFNLYQKGSLPISFILDLLNIDADETLTQLKRDLFGPNDANFNEFVRAVLTKAGEEAGDVTDIMEKVTAAAGLKYSKKAGDRYGKGEE